MEPSKRSNIAGQLAGRPDYSHAIETAYRNYLFRSRLEAKYAAFFDLCGWAWSYEPVDMNGWIPDFAIGERPVLVEIKPFWNDDQWGEAKEKIIRSGCDKEVLLLGADPTWRMKNVSDACESGAPPFGLLFDQLDRANSDEWCDEEVYFGFTEGNNKYGLCPLDGGWWNLIWKPTTDDHANKWSRVHPNSDDRNKPDAEECAEIMWAQACNASKWIPHVK